MHEEGGDELEEQHGAASPSLPATRARDVGREDHVALDEDADRREDEHGGARVGLRPTESTEEVFADERHDADDDGGDEGEEVVHVEHPVGRQPQLD